MEKLYPEMTNHEYVTRNVDALSRFLTRLTDFQDELCKDCPFQVKEKVSLDPENLKLLWVMSLIIPHLLTNFTIIKDILRWLIYEKILTN